LLSKIAQLQDQIAYVSDASVIVGIHGAGLALSIFAPSNHSCLIEIVPAQFNLHLFQNVRSFAIDYEQVRLSEQSSINKAFSNLILSNSDIVRIKRVLDVKLEASKRKLRTMSG
jgi:capsular polysaccharide biosynthesis protein